MTTARDPDDMTGTAADDAADADLDALRTLLGTDPSASSVPGPSQAAFGGAAPGDATLDENGGAQDDSDQDGSDEDGSDQDRPVEDATADDALGGDVLPDRAASDPDPDGR